MSHFLPADPLAVAASGLDAADVHVWRLPHRRGAGRGALAALLGAYLGVPASALAFVAGAHGKPSLAPPHARLAFSWSHSGDYALAALGRDAALGVDVEHVQTRPRLLELAERYFAAEEAAALRGLAGAARTEAFFTLWTAKEAVLKALGRGLAFGPARVAFALQAAGARPLAFADDAAPASDWQLHALAPAPGYAGAVAWRGGARRVRTFAAAAPPG
ncbi:MAG: 4'-phosphopantetheinyl transferase superfamily protein [Mizugakiibacter sp.]|uniref:4'-phosphopantetheinyl transferase family protein n=1 Tax=Mizugakiibacter sp. TaxID=1972610 RepID=UPI0031C1C7B5|nr:4'-phosphopantetheinyl transferase superfamily protein [Xanthomonadaceae bacterium]